MITNMTTKEKKLIGMLFALAGLGFMFKGAPYAYNSYQQGREDVVNLKVKKNRLTRLLGKENYWKGELNKKLEQEKELKKQYFTAKSNELVAAKIQSIIKQIAKSSGVNIESIRLAEFQQSGEWLLVSLSVNVRGNSASVMGFLAKLQSNQQKLFIKEMSLHSNRNLLSGSVTLVGFSQSVDNTAKKDE